MPVFFRSWALHPLYFIAPSTASQFTQHLAFYSSDRFEYVSNTIWLVVSAGAGMYMAVVRGRDAPENSWWSAPKEVIFLLALLAMGFLVPGWLGFLLIIGPALGRFITEWRRLYWGKRHA